LESFSLRQVDAPRPFKPSLTCTYPTLFPCEIKHKRLLLGFAGSVVCYHPGRVSAGLAPGTPAGLGRPGYSVCGAFLPAFLAALAVFAALAGAAPPLLAGPTSPSPVGAAARPVSLLAPSATDRPPPRRERDDLAAADGMSRLGADGDAGAFLIVDRRGPDRAGAVSSAGAGDGAAVAAGVFAGVSIAA